jgi:ABC-type histidine transport system ATPase subunit
MVDIEPVVTLFSEINKLDPEMISELKKIQDKRNKEG